MDTTVLVIDRLEEGKNLLRYLDSRDMEISVAFWLYDERRKWQLILSMPEVAMKGARFFYRQLIDLIKEMQPETPTQLTIADITILREDEELIQALRIAENSGFIVSGKKITGTVVNGIYIEDAYLYRIN